MTFSPNIVPDITESLPALLSAREASQTAVKNGTRFDISIAGVSFMLGCDTQHPYLRQSAQVTKDQFDNSKEAGEQTLDGWWLRSQTSWHLGSGINFYDPGVDALSEYRSDTTVGVNVWERDELTLLNKMAAVGSADGNQHLTSGVLPNGHGAIFLQGASGLSRIEMNNGMPGTSTAYTGKTPTTRPVIAGGSVLSSYSGGIVKGDLTGSTLADLWTQASGDAPMVYWVKDRIIATKGKDVYELTLAGGDLDSETAVYSHPEPDWSWNAVAEHPNGILLAGESAGHSAIYLITIEQDATSGTPELGAPSSVAQFPFGERVYALQSYLGSYIGIGTSRGVRVGVLDQNGLTYGPLVIETDNPVLDLAASDIYLWAAVTDAIDGKSGVARIGLEQTIGDGLRFPWAWDVNTHQTGTCRGVAITNYANVVACVVDGKPLYVEDVDTPEDSGYVTSGAVRYGTVEPKAFLSVDVECETGDGHVSVEALPESAELPYSLGTLGSTSGHVSLDFKLGQSEQWVKLKFILTSGDTTQPKLQSWQIKALPKPRRRQRMIQVPLMCFDQERPVRSAAYGRDGFAFERLRALEVLEESASTVQVEDYTVGETFTAVIEQIEFERDASRRENGAGNFGGRITLLLRRLS